MSADTSMTFYVTGDDAVTTCVADLLSGAGYKASSQQKADVVFTYSSNTSKLEDLYYDTKGLVQDTKQDAILIDLSPATVSFARELGTLASVNDRKVLDAPLIVRNVVAPDAFAHVDNLGMVVGGSEAVFNEVRPMLDAIARDVMWVAKAGAGQSMKVALTLQNAAALVGLVEAFASFDVSQSKVDKDDYLDFSYKLGMLTPGQEAFLQAMHSNSFQGSFTIELMMGELAAALESVDDNDVILPQAESGFRLMELLALVGGVDYTPAALKLVFADEDTTKQYGLDWQRAEGAFEHDHDCDCECDHDDPDHECACGNHDDPNHECCGGHHHAHNQSMGGFMGFSAN